MNTLQTKRSSGKPKFELPKNPTEQDLRKFREIERKRKWREANKDKIHRSNTSEWYKVSKEKYKEQNREKYLEGLRRWYQENQERLKQPVQCDVCGKEYKYYKKAVHFKTKYHLKACDEVQGNKEQTTQ